MSRALCRLRSASILSRGPAFTLIEVLGAVALLAILMAVAANPLIQSLRAAQRRSEKRMVARIGEAFERAVLRNKNVPSTNPLSWVPVVAAELSLPEDTVGLNGVGVPRLVVLDPALRLGALGPGGLPYQQGSAGATSVVSPRLVIVSALQAAYPAVDLHSPSGFSNLWNRSDLALPLDWPAQWSSEAGDLVVQRVDLGRLFHEVVLNNLDRSSPAPFATLAQSLSGVGSTNSVGITNGPVVTRFIQGTPLRLVRSDGVAQAVTLITESSSFVFEKGRWSRRVESGAGGSSTCGTLGTLVETFMNHPDWDPTALGTTPESVVLGMFDMLCGCRDWSDAGFENENGHSKWEAPTARFVFDVAPQLMLSSEDLIGK